MFAEALGREGYAAYRVRLDSLLSIPPDATDNQIHQQIMDGFPAARLVELCEKGDISPIERDQIVPLRTLKTRLSKKQPLSVWLPNYRKWLRTNSDINRYFLW